MDYKSYRMNLRERAAYTALAGIFIFCVAFIFYRSILISTAMLPLALLYPRIRTRDIISKRKKELNMQFKDLLYSLSSSVSAGKTVEGAFREALKDLAVMYPEPETFIIAEIKIILGKLETNEPLESALADFARRAGLEDIDNFVSVFNICKRTGGNIADVIRSTSAIISDRIEVGMEVDAILAERKFEQKVLNVMPIFIILLLSITAPDYMRPVFATGAGRLTMSVSILLLASAWLISSKLTDIKL